MKTTADMKAAIQRMIWLYEESERLDDINEAASDRAYEEAHAIAETLIETITRISRGMIDRKTARLMVLKTPEKLIGICEMF